MKASAHFRKIKLALAIITNPWHNQLVASQMAPITGITPQQANTKRFTDEEDDELRYYCGIYGTDWVTIGQKIRRPARAVRDRALNYLFVDPQEWDPETDALVLHLVAIHGRKWRKIADLMYDGAITLNPQRVKLRWHQLQPKNPIPLQKRLSPSTQIPIIPTTQGVSSLTQTLIQLHLPSGQ
jgi:hypothetical protein